MDFWAAAHPYNHYPFIFGTKGVSNKVCPTKGDVLVLSEIKISYI